MKLGDTVLYCMHPANCGWTPVDGDFAKGNQNHPGDWIPAVISKVWPGEYENGTVDGFNIMAIPDGRTPIWVTSVREGVEPGNIRAKE